MDWGKKGVEVMFTQHRAYKMAYDFLSDVTDYAGDSIFEHSMRVAMSLPSGPARIVGALHDMLEDSGYTQKALHRAGVAAYHCVVIHILTRQEGQTYREYIERVAKDELATQVKLADLNDHLRVEGAHHIPPSLVLRYQKAAVYLVDGEWM